MAEIHIGVALPTMSEITALGPAGIETAARHAEDIGLDFVTASDVLVGDGTLALEPIVVIAAAAAVTERIQLTFGVLSLPTRPTAMLAAQVQSLQYLSGNRLSLGVGTGGFAGSPFWQAISAPVTGRAALTDRALEVLPGLISGEPTELPDVVDRPVVTMSPAVPVPPILIGGSAAASVLRRVSTYADGWLPSALTAAEIVAAATRLRELTVAQGRPVSEIQLGVHAVLGEGTEERSAREAMTEQLSEYFAMEPEKITEVTITGGPNQVAERIAEYAAAGVTGLGFGLDAPNYLHQLDLIAEARALLD